MHLIDPGSTKELFCVIVLYNSLSTVTAKTVSESASFTPLCASGSVDACSALAETISVIRAAQCATS